MDQIKSYDNLDLTGLAGLDCQWSDFHTRRFGGQIDLAYTLGKSWPVTQFLNCTRPAARRPCLPMPMPLRTPISYYWFGGVDGSDSASGANRA